MPIQSCRAKALCPVLLNVVPVMHTRLDCDDFIFSKQDAQEQLQNLHETSQPLEEAWLLAIDFSIQHNYLASLPCQNQNQATRLPSNDNVISFLTWNLAGWSAPSKDQPFLLLSITILKSFSSRKLGLHQKLRWMGQVSFGHPN